MLNISHVSLSTQYSILFIGNSNDDEQMVTRFTSTGSSAHTIDVQPHIAITEIHFIVLYYYVQLK